MAEEVGLSYAEPSFGRGRLEVVLAQTLEQLADGADMFCGANAGLVKLMSMKMTRGLVLDDG